MQRVEKRVEKLIGKAIERSSVAIGSEGDHLLAKVKVGGNTFDLHVIWAGEGWPEDVRNADRRIGGREGARTVFAARRFSTGALKSLEAEGANWVDETGRARIVVDGLVVIRDGDELRESAAASKGRTGWSASAIDVAEAVLSMPVESTIRIADVSTLTAWSVPQVSKVLQRFDQAGWLQQLGSERGRGARRVFADRAALLEEWSAIVAEKTVEPLFGHTLTRDPMGFLEDALAPELNNRCDWAVSAWAGVERIAPFMTTVPTLQIYVPEEDLGPELVSDLGLSRVESGGVVEFRPARRVVFQTATTDSAGIRVASPARVFADLRALGGRGEDAAEHLREQILGGPGEVGQTDHRPHNPEDIADWNIECSSRFQRRLNEAPSDELRTVYRYGYWTASYVLVNSRNRPKLPELLDAMRSRVGRETGWPVWLLPDGMGIKPKPVDGAIECLLAHREDDKPSDSDFWLASPEGKFFLLRGYQEDDRREGLEPGRWFDITLPVWRTGECLLHARRMADYFGAERIACRFQWDGLAGRELFSWNRERSMPTVRTSAQSSVSTVLEMATSEIDADLEALVRESVEPLFAVFDFFQPTESLYEQELKKMRAGV